MNPLRSLISRLSGKERDRRDGDLERELQTHIDLETEERNNEGLGPEEASYAARRTFGNSLRVAEETREEWGWASLERLLQDVRFGIRILLRNPGFSFLAVFCLTLGIGANAAVFTWIEGILLRPFPAVADQSRLMAVVGTARGTTGYDDLSWPDFLELRNRCTLIESFIGEKITGATLSIGDRAEIAPGSLVSANYFNALGVPPVLGRGFEPGEDAGRNAHPVVVISYQLWQRRFRGDPNIIGKMQMLNSVPHTIIGVAPKGFYGTFVGYTFQFWVPISMQERFDAGGYKLENRDARWLEPFVRLKPGITRAQAQQEISAAAAQLEAEFPSVNRGRGVRLLPLWQTPFNHAGELLPILEVAQAVAFLVLLIACANVGNLLIVRSFARRHEITVRIAVGARRGRLLAQLLTEGVILSGIAAVAGVVVAYWARNGLVRVIPLNGAYVFLPGKIDWRVLAFSAGICILATLLAGIVPSLQASNIDVAGALRCESSGVSGSGKARLRSGLVLLQVALSFVLLVGAGLVLHSLQSVLSANPGFRTEGLLMTTIEVSSGYDSQRTRNYQEQLLDRVQAMSGIESAAYTRVPVFSYRSYSSARIATDGYTPPANEQPTAEYSEVSPAYFATMDIPLVSGREFSKSDNETAAPVAIVNQVMAEKYWPGGDPLGKRLQVNGKWMRIAGVAKNIKYQNFMEQSKPFFYVPLTQNSADMVALVMRTSQNAGSLTTSLAREVHALDPALPVYDVITMREQINRQTSSHRIAVILLGVFGTIALILAAVGLYAVMSYSVSQSTRELGLRSALGATASNLLRLVIFQGLSLTMAGLALGALAALALSGLLGSLLYKVSPRDPLAFGMALLLMLLASLAACFFPAWRASRIEPVRVLKD